MRTLYRTVKTGIREGGTVRGHAQSPLRRPSREAAVSCDCLVTAKGGAVRKEQKETKKTKGISINSAMWFGVLVALLWSGGRATAAAVLYQTSFESTEGYTTNLDLVGQKGWVGLGSGGNGIATGFFAGKGQQAYVGFTPPRTNDTTLFVYQPINKSVPRAQFAVTLAIIDSSNGNWDDFYWAVFNQQGQQLVTLDFDNFSTNVFYFLEGSTNRTATGVKFSNSIAYQLNMILDYTSNRWSATLGPDLLATNQPITTSGAPLNLGDIDAAWVVYTPAAPGDNFMVFDDYQISASVPQPRLSLLGMVNGSPTLRLTGLTNIQFAIDASTNVVDWLPLKTNITSGGSFDYVDDAGAGLPRRFYRARWVP